MNAVVKTKYIPNELIISRNEDVFSKATKEEKLSGLTDLFIGLTAAITKHGCEVDISDPDNIIVKKPNNGL
jgi:hypothetical protein